MKRILLVLPLVGLAACRTSSESTSESAKKQDLLATKPTIVESKEAPNDRRCGSLDGFVSIERPDSVWLSVRSDAMLDTFGAGMHTDTLIMMDLYKLGRTSAGYVYFDFGMSEDPSFTLLDADSAHVYPDRFPRHNRIRSFDGTELRLLDDSTVEACGIANAYTNRSRTYSLGKDSLQFQGCTLLDTSYARSVAIPLNVYADSLLTRPSCTIPAGQTVQVVQTVVTDGCRETGVFQLRAKSCSGWYGLAGASNSPVTGLYYHGD